MIPRPELHPDDPAARVVLNRRLWKIRQDAGITTTELAARLGTGRETARDLEKSSSWEVRRVQAWARALDHRFAMIVTGIRLPEPDFDAMALRAVTTFGALDEDRLHLRIVVDDLVRAQRASGESITSFARRCGVNGRAIIGWERDHEATLLKMVQRYARALGGSLELAVLPVRAPAEVAS
jgi:transcriptional regulator with XRE-family HTH domain